MSTEIGYFLRAIVDDVVNKIPHLKSQIHLYGTEQPHKFSVLLLTDRT